MCAPKKENRINWDKQPFGKIPDTEIAIKIGVTQEAVRYQRNKRGIPPASRLKYYWYDIDKMLGKIPDSEISKKTKIPYQTLVERRNKLGIKSCVHHHKNIDWDNFKQWNISDTEIARMMGIDRSSVNNARRTRGIPQIIFKCKICNHTVGLNSIHKFCSNCRSKYQRQIAKYARHPEVLPIMVELKNLNDEIRKEI